jgi:hypothetical protein
MTQLPLPLPANRAFVVQFRAQPQGAPFRWEGRAEHLTSGQTARFASQDELWAFMTRVITEISESPEAR